MIQITPGPTPLEITGELVDAGAERTRELIGMLAGRAQEVADSADFDARTARATMQRLIGQFAGDDIRCASRVQAAEDRMRLRSALIAGVVVFVITTLAFVIAREIANRRAARQRPAEHEVEEAGS